jgi:serine/threonine protein kinase
MSPERIAYSEHPTYTAAADVWSLGIALWEAAMGYYPFSGKRFDSVFAQLNAIVNCALPPFDERLSDDCKRFILLWFVFRIDR